jgi:hypothetical protein
MRGRDHFVADHPEHRAGLAGGFAVMTVLAAAF